MSFSSNTTSSHWTATMCGWVCGLTLAAAAPRPVCAQDHPAPPPSTAATSDEPMMIYFGPKFQKDRVTVYKFMADNSSVQTQNNEDMLDSTYTESIMRFTVNEVYPDGSADMTMTYDRIFTQGHAFFGGDYVFDSTLEQQDAQTDARIVDAFRKLAASTVKFHSDAKGDIDPASVVGTEDACAAMTDLTAIQARIGEFTSVGLADLFKSTWRVGNDVYTRDVTKPWQDVEKSPVEGMGTWTFTSDYQMLDQDPQRVVLGMKMLMELEFQPPDVEIEGMLKILDTKFDMLKGDWRYIWDRENSELKERSGELEFTWLILQEGIFENETVRTVQHQHVISSLTRIDP